MKMNRRDFIKTAVVAGSSLVLSQTVARPALAAAPANGRTNGFAILSDFTKCVGCRRCEAACNRANKLPAPKVPFENPTVFNEKRRTDAQAYTVINEYSNPKWKKSVYRKIQCNHCAEPACASACLVGALKKTDEGAVIYNEDLCIGCRYCMTACPFYIPAFEYNDPGSPAIQKCTMCYHRVANGGIPACAEACSVGAITFGKKADIIKIARERISREPDKYVDHIYGETEVGGTDWLYVSGVPFEQLDFPTNLGTTPFPELTKEFLSAVPLVIVVWPALLGGFYAWSNKRQQTIEAQTVNHKREDSEQ